MGKLKKSKRKEFIEICKNFFEKGGEELNSSNGILLPKDLDLEGYKKEWSKDVAVLTKCGIALAYYRPEEKQFTVKGQAFMDLFVKDCAMESNKFVTISQLNNFLSLPENKHLFEQ